MIPETRHSPHHPAKRRLQYRRTNAFTMVEAMVAVALIGIILGISIRESGSAYNRDKLNEASLLLRGWLLEIANNPDTTGQSCAITISTGTITTDGQIASVLPTTCSTTPTLRLPGNFTGLTFNVGTTQTTWSFTRRTAIDSANNVVIKLSLNDFTALRCVRVQAISGLIRLGRNDATSDVNGTCNNWNSI